EGGWLRQPQPHQRDQALAAGQHLGVPAVPAEVLRRLVHRGGDGVLEGCRDHARASWMSDQMRSGRAGISTCLMPNGERASTTALITAALAAIVPASPMPLTPSSLVGLGVTVRSSSNMGISAMVGTR